MIMKDKEFINKIYSEYQIKYNIILPKINNVILSQNDNFWARFLAHELYERKYNLYIDNKLLEQDERFIKPVLFHEFTHVADCMEFINTEYETYRNYMTSYSEFHAAKIEMKERIEQTIPYRNHSSLSLQTEIMYTDKITIKSFMDQSFGFMKNDLLKMSKNSDFSNFFYNTNHIYYFFGYYSALKEYEVTYKYNLYETTPEFIICINNIEKTLINPNLDTKSIIEAHLKLEDAIKKQCVLNRILKRTF